MRLVMLAALALGLCVSPAARAAENVNLAVGSSIVGGSIHIMGAALAKVITEKVDGAYATAQNTSGPQANLQMIETGEMKIGIVSNPVLYEAMEGKAQWTMGRQFGEFRTIAVLYSSLLQIFAIKPEIKNVRDLEGRTLNVSAPGSTSDQLGTIVPEILGIKLRKNHSITATGCDMLRDGRLDAVCVSMGVPAPTFTDLQVTTSGRVLQMSKEDVAAIVARVPYLSPASIPADTYKQQPEALNTVALWNVVVVHKDLSDDLVYAITRAMVENRDAFAAASSIGKDFAAENIRFAVGPVHPGAERYYREIGVALP